MKMTIGRRSRDHGTITIMAAAAANVSIAAEAELIHKMKKKRLSSHAKNNRHQDDDDDTASTEQTEEVVPEVGPAPSFDPHTSFVKASQQHQTTRRRRVRFDLTTTPTTRAPIQPPPQPRTCERADEQGRRPHQPPRQRRRPPHIFQQPDLDEDDACAQPLLPKRFATCTTTVPNDEQVLASSLSTLWYTVEDFCHFRQASHRQVQDLLQQQQRLQVKTCQPTEDSTAARLLSAYADCCRDQRQEGETSPTAMSASALYFDEEALGLEHAVISESPHGGSRATKIRNHVQRTLKAWRAIQTAAPFLSRQQKDVALHTLLVAASGTNRNATASSSGGSGCSSRADALYARYTAEALAVSEAAAAAARDG